MEKRLLHLPGVAPAVHAKLLGKSRELKRSFDMRFSGGALGLVSQTKYHFDAESIYILCKYFSLLLALRLWCHVSEAEYQAIFEVLNPAKSGSRIEQGSRFGSEVPRFLPWHRFDAWIVGTVSIFC